MYITHRNFPFLSEKPGEDIRLQGQYPKNSLSYIREFSGNTYDVMLLQKFVCMVDGKLEKTN